MTYFWIALAVVVLALVYLLAIKPCGRRNAVLHRCTGRPYAHRGLYDREAGIPENSLTALGRAADMGFAMELDVRMTADKKLVVMHDANIARMTGADVNILDATAAELEQYRLAGTDEHIPTFDEVLERVAGRVPLMIEIKVVGGEYPELGRLVCERLDAYDGDFMLESFNPHMIRWLRKNRSDLPRGQLSTKYRKHGDKNMSPMLDFVLSNYLFNFLTKPDFLAMYYEDRDALSVRICRGLYSTPVFVWTTGTPEQQAICEKKRNNTVIFEHYIPEKK